MLGGRTRGRTRGLAATAALLLAGAGWWTGAAGPAAAATGCGASVPGDVNGDGQAEVAVGEPFHAGASGAVHLLYGTSDGLAADASGSARNDQYLTQDSPGVPGSSERDDDFGQAVALADFNDDGCADLAVGAPGENQGAGMVTVLYGSPTGLVTTGAQAITENTVFGSGSTARDEVFAAALATADLDDNGFADLIVGAPGEVVAGRAAAGAVVVLWGGPDGLATAHIAATLVSQQGSAVPGTPEAADVFGSSVAGGDVDGDGVDDLAVGVPGEDGGRGVVQVLPGADHEPPGAEAGHSYSQDTPGVPGAAEADDHFGAAVALGDATGDGRADLTAGAPGENGDGSDHLGQGAVSFLPGSAGGLTGTGAQTWTQNSPGVDGVAGPDDEFGSTLVMAPLDGGTLADVAIGTPLDAVGAVREAGSVTVLLGTAGGLSTADEGGIRFHQDVPGIAGSAEPLDFFGLSLAAAYVQTPGLANLVIGAPGEDIGGVRGTGQIHQLQTFEFGPNPSGSRTFHLDTPGVQGTPDSGGFGYSLS